MKSVKGGNRIRTLAGWIAHGVGGDQKDPAGFAIGSPPERTEPVFFDFIYEGLQPIGWFKIRILHPPA
jgi:hypothetical protein